MAQSQMSLGEFLASSGPEDFGLATAKAPPRRKSVLSKIFKRKKETEAEENLADHISIINLEEVDQSLDKKAETSVLESKKDADDGELNISSPTTGVDSISTKDPSIENVIHSESSPAIENPCDPTILAPKRRLSAFQLLRQGGTSSLNTALPAIPEKYNIQEEEYSIGSSNDIEQGYNEIFSEFVSPTTSLRLARKSISATRRKDLMTSENCIDDSLSSDDVTQ